MATPHCRCRSNGAEALPDTAVDIDRFATPHYHQALRDHLRATEPELWSWFRESAEPTSSAVEQAELELLKTTYRLDGNLHDVLTGFATLISGKLGLGDDVVLYQALGESERNARVMRLGDKVHIVFSGDLLELLDLEEQEAVLAHELAHIALHDRDSGDYAVLDRLLHRIDIEAVANDAVGETARRLRLHAEVFADAVALDILGDARPVVSSIVKVNSGLRNVDPDAYLRQARQIVEADPSASAGWTHPELHVRVACLAARASPAGSEIITQLIEGPDDLDRMDLLGQLRIQALVGRVLAIARGLYGAVDNELWAYLQSFPVDNHLAVAPIEDGELAGASPSIRHLCAALLVDVALLSDADGLERLTVFSREAERQGSGSSSTEFSAGRSSDRWPTCESCGAVHDLCPTVE